MLRASQVLGKVQVTRVLSIGYILADQVAIAEFKRGLYRVGQALAGGIGLVFILQAAHHQAVDRPGHGLVVTARSVEPDPVVEAVEPPDPRLVLGVQEREEEADGDRLDPGLLQLRHLFAGLRLVGVEYVVFKADWDAKHDSWPTLFGQNLKLVQAGNRYGLPDFYELHAWIWRPNPSGIFQDWNPSVTCRGNGDPA